MGHSDKRSRPVSKSSAAPVPAPKMMGHLSPARHFAAITMCVLCTALVVGCTKSGASTAPHRTPTHRTTKHRAPHDQKRRHEQKCSLNSKLVPTCGTLWGVNPTGHSYKSLRKSERAAQRKFDFVYRFHDIDDRVPDADDRTILDSGRVLHITIDARKYAKPAEKAPRWEEITSGAFDHELVAQARGIASLKRPVFITFDHEPDQPRKARRGSPSDYVAAWQHVHRIFDKNHAKNAVWVWVATGWIPSADAALRMWPGNNYVDWISWEVYDDAGCRDGQPDSALSKSFPELANKFLTYLMAHGQAAGINTKKPMMISESGTAITPQSRRTQWYRAIPSYLKRHRQIKAVALWDHDGREPACRFSFSTSRHRSKDVAIAGHSRVLNPLQKH